MTEVALAVGAVVLLGAIALLPFFVSFLNDLEAKVTRLRAMVPHEHEHDAAGGLPAESGAGSGTVAGRGTVGAGGDHTP